MFFRDLRIDGGLGLGSTRFLCSGLLPLFCFRVPLFGKKGILITKGLAGNLAVGPAGARLQRTSSLSNGELRRTTVDDINPALPIIENIP